MRTIVYSSKKHSSGIFFLFLSFFRKGTKRQIKKKTHCDQQDPIKLSKTLQQSQFHAAKMMYFKAEHIIVDVDTVDISYTLALVQQCYTTIVMTGYELKKDIATSFQMQW